MFKFPGGLGDMLKQAQQIQHGVTELKGSLEQKIVEGRSAEGKVVFSATGACEVLSVTIDPSLLSSEPRVLEEMVKVAANDALKQAKEFMKQEVSRLAGGLPIPGL